MSDRATVTFSIVPALSFEMSDDKDEYDLFDVDRIDQELYGESVLEERSESSLIDWKQMNVEESSIAAMNRLLHGGPLDNFDRFVLNYDLTLREDATDLYPDWHPKTDLDPMLWALLLKKARNEASDEKLEFHLKGNPDTAREAGFEGRDDVPRNTTFWRAYADDEPRFDEETMELLDIEAKKIVHHAKYVGFDLPESAEEYVTEPGLNKQDLMAEAEEIAQRLLKRVLPHIAFGRDSSRTTYSLPSIASFLAHLTLEDAFPENGTETFAYLNIYKSGGTGADNLYYHMKQRTAEEWFDRFLRANSELLVEAREMGHFEDTSEAGFDTTGIPWYGDKSETFVDGTKPQRNHSYAFHFSTVGIVGTEASLSLAAHHLRNRDQQDKILKKLMQRVQNLHYFADDQLDVDIERAYLDKGFYGGMHVDALRTTGTDFMIKARKTSPVKDVIDNLEKWDVSWGIMQNYEIGDLSEGTNIFLVPSEKRAPRYGKDSDEEKRKYGRWVGFVTDINPVTADREKLTKDFRNRWGVETQYRQLKHDFYPPTKSGDGSVRTFHFNLAQLFYNIYVMVNMELRHRFRLPSRRPLTADDVLHVIRDCAFELDDLPE